MFSSSNNNMDDIHVNITDGENESEDSEMEIEESGLELETEQQEEHRKHETTSACKPPRPNVSGTKRKSKYWAHFHDTTDPGTIKCKYYSKSICSPLEMELHGGPQTKYNWNRIKAFLPFLKIFYETTLKLSGCLYVMDNTYVPRIYGVGYVISTYSDNESEFIRSMTHAMKAKYHKYRANVDNINILLFIVLVLDLRYKLDYVEWLVRTNCNVESTNMSFLKIKVTSTSMFDFYASCFLGQKGK
ncbi:hypothetical protein Cgig2_003394 [Carnegiea gigantea]|uniref:hAT-like transposase RNase-H fold domain-containing protein n=1 Tax=Carnegiea gigantea TaxID=171969 RepID=A0A9Q1JPW2_9CARY|nr:hypothetical protein Cgig2_003394 [Carnegiea gigantea]